MKTIFWNVDTQYDFMRDDESFHGALAIHGAREIEGNLEKLTKLAKEKNILTVNTADWHTGTSEELSDTPDFKKTFPVHCLEYTKGAEYIPATMPLNEVICVHWDKYSRDPHFKDDELYLDQIKIFIDKENSIIKGLPNFDIVILKDNFDVFKGNPYTDEILKMIRPEAAVVYGVATNVCVDYAVRGLLERGIKVYVPTDAIKELPGLPLEEVLNNWKEKGAVLTKTKEILADKYDIIKRNLEGGN